MKITKKDRLKYPSHTDLAIIGKKLISRLSAKQLQSIWKRKTKSPYFKQIFDAMGNNTNPVWITQEAGSQLVDRGLLDFVGPA